MITYSKIISKFGRVAFPSLLWNYEVKDKCIYLTFDDGPIPEITPWVLQKLKDFNAKATFFCIGDNILKNPEIFKMIESDDHVIGNHSHNHLDGWKTRKTKYIQNVLKAEGAIRNVGSALKSTTPTLSEKKLFRPPYGRIKPAQIKALENLGYKIVMWDVISGDYNQTRQPQTCLKNVIKNAQAGSIVVLHDSTKAYKNLKMILPEILSYYSAEGFEFRSL